jgi:hypothetical protein
MTARRLALAVGVVTMTGSAGYLFVYLSRWEWNRALIAGLVLVAVETAVFAGLLMGRLERVEDRLDRLGTDLRASGTRPAGSAEAMRAELRSGRPAPARRYDWLAPPDRLGVFIPVLLGAGAVL